MENNKEKVTVKITVGDEVVYDKEVLNIISTMREVDFEENDQQYKEGMSGQGSCVAMGSIGMTDVIQAMKNIEEFATKIRKDTVKEMLCGLSKLLSDDLDINSIDSFDEFKAALEKEIGGNENV